MNKKNELKKMIKGKGVAAFEPETQFLEENELSQNKSEYSDNQIKLEREMEKIKKLEELKEKEATEDNSKVTMIEPSSEDFEIITKLIQRQEVYLKIWDVEIRGERDLESVIRKNDRMSFKIKCTAAPLLVDLKASYSIDIIVIDLKKNTRQLLYCKTIQRELKHKYFEALSSSQASIEGIYHIRCIIELEESGIFDVWENLVPIRIM